MYCRTCNWMPRVSLFSSWTRMRPNFSSEIRSVTSPCSSKFWRPPSRPTLSTRRSSCRKWTLQKPNLRHVYNHGAYIISLNRSLCVLCGLSTQLHHPSRWTPSSLRLKLHDTTFAAADNFTTAVFWGVMPLRLVKLPMFQRNLLLPSSMKNLCNMPWTTSYHILKEQY